MKNNKWILCPLFLIYCLFVVWVTIISRKPTRYSGIKLEIFWAYRALFTGNPHGLEYVKQNISNIVFFIPYGVLMPRRDCKTIIISATCFSMAIEVLQLFMRRGYCELDDVICNMFGSLLGYYIVLGLKRVVSKEN